MNNVDYKVNASFLCGLYVKTLRELLKLTVIFPLEFLLNLLRAGSVRAHKSQQPLLQVGRGAKANEDQNKRKVI